MAVLLLLVALTGCGGDDSSSDTPSTSPPPTRPQAEVDKERAARTVLTAADLPGYTEDTSPDTQGSDAAVAKCVKDAAILTAKEATNPRTVEGKKFQKTEETSVISKATVAETEDQAKAALNEVRSKTVVDCIGREARAELVKGLDPGVTITSVTVTVQTVAPVGDEATGVRFAVTLTAQGDTARVMSDTTFIRKDREIAFLTTATVNSSFPESERASLATKMAGRMAP